MANADKKDNDIINVQITINAVLRANGEDHQCLAQKLNDDVYAAVYDGYLLNGGDTSCELLSSTFATALVDQKSAIVDAFDLLKDVYDSCNDDIEDFNACFADFANQNLKDMLIIKKYDPENVSARLALATTFYPPKDSESINWNEPLFDSDGFPNSLVSLSAFEAVTKCSISYVVWDRKTGGCKDCADLKLGNTPMSEAEREVRRQAVLQTLRSEPLVDRMDQQAEATKKKPSSPSPF